ncbi:MAG: FAD-dependent oxidoreductase [Candidatus Eisenbacteria bacterium]|nr:FAD-dependent oxidoreductase [Candidatus Eisenbacteria bacterium]
MNEDVVTSDSRVLVTSASHEREDCAELVQPSPCSQACPIGTNVKAYVSLIATGRFDEALAVASEPNPFPGICGRVCTHPCEDKCNRSERDDPVAIAWLKRFAADYELRRGRDKVKPANVWRKEKIAIVGAGPAGLTAAKDLVLKGYPVTVFEALPKPGGMLYSGIPTFRLPRRIIDIEIAAIKDLGVTIKTGTTFGKDVTLDSLKAEGYKAFLLAIGAYKSLKLGVPGEELNGVHDCLGFLFKVNEGKHPGLSGKVAVIGGGSSAVDSARAAVRVGAESVEIFYRRTEKEMPAAKTEVEEAKHEGVKVHLLVAPVEVIGKDGKVTAMKLQKMQLGEPDASGRRRPVPIEGSEYVVEIDHVISAIGQQPDVSFAQEMKDLKITRWNTVETNSETLRSSMEGVYAAGDAVTGPATVVGAIASGHRAASAIHSFLSGERMVLPPGMGETRREYELKPPEPPVLPRKSIEKHEVKSFKGNFEEIELGFTEAAAMEEALRCMRCGPCFECELCIQECEKEVMVFGSSRSEIFPFVVRVPEDARDSLDGARAVLSLSATTSDAKPEAGRQTGTAETQIEGTLVNIVAAVNEELCRGCGKCEEVCLYAAPRVSYKKERGALISSVNEKECKGCGTCVAMCPSGAMQQKYFSDEMIIRTLKEHLAPVGEEAATATS